MFRYLSAIVAFGAVVLFAGCGTSMVKVNGVVTLDGNPVEGATVTFVSEDGANMYIGRTDPSGQFSLGAGEKNQGAPAGTYKVLIVKTPVIPGAESMSAGSPEATKTMAKMASEQSSKSGGTPLIGMMKAPTPGASGPKIKSELPTVYAAVDSTPFTVKVPPPAQPVTLDLKSK